MTELQRNAEPLARDGNAVVHETIGRNFLALGGGEAAARIIAFGAVLIVAVGAAGSWRYLGPAGAGASIATVGVLVQPTADDQTVLGSMPRLRGEIYRLTSVDKREFYRVPAVDGRECFATSSRPTIVQLETIVCPRDFPDLRKIVDFSVFETTRSEPRPHVVSHGARPRRTPSVRRSRQPSRRRCRD